MGALIAAVAVCTLLATPAAAPAKNVQYSGPIDQQSNPYHDDPRIEFTVHFAKNDKGKLVPKSVPKLTAWNIWYHCTIIPPGSGNTSGNWYPGATSETSSQVVFGGGLGVKKHGHVYGFGPSSYEDYGEGMEVSGVIPKSGSASGTVRIFYTSQPGDEVDVGNCDSGPLNWTASTG